MSIGTVITEGFGSLGDVAHVVTDGFGIGLVSQATGIGLAAVPIAPVDFVLNGGYMVGVRVPKFRTANKMLKQGPNQWPSQPEETELKEMMGIYAMWKRAA